jgi:mRNA-degrading endonuclease RelE of RelBE toxin-antitoxin system
MRFSVEASPLAQAQIDELKAQALRSPGTNHQKKWLALRGVLERLGLDMVALCRDNALSRELSNVWRDKTGRWRIFYILSSEQQRLVILMLGEGRKEGDKNDPYPVFRRHLKRGEFDAHFADLGVTKPKL